MAEPQMTNPELDKIEMVPWFDPKVTPISMGQLYRVLEQRRQVYEDMLKIAMWPPELPKR